MVINGDRKTKTTNNTHTKISGFCKSVGYYAAMLGKKQEGKL